MPSVDDKSLVDKLIAQNGYYDSDSRVHQIAQYTNQWGGTTYHLSYSKADMQALAESPFCHDIVILWRPDYVKERG